MSDLTTQQRPNKALHLTAYSLRLAALCSGFRQQVSLGVRRLRRKALKGCSVVSNHAGLHNIPATALGYTPDRAVAKFSTGHFLRLN
jgi:hypothetical protein